MILNMWHKWRHIYICKAKNVIQNQCCAKYMSYSSIESSVDILSHPLEKKTDPIVIMSCRIGACDRVCYLSSLLFFWPQQINIYLEYIPRNMHTVFALLCFVVVIHWLIFPYPSGLLHWHCGNLTIAPVPAKQPWWIWINTSCEFIMNDCITTTKQSTTKPCAYFLGYTVE